MAVASRCSRQRGKKQPQQKYFITNDHKSELYIHSYTVSRKKVPPSSCYNLDIHDPITMIFDREVLRKSEIPPHLSSVSALPYEKGNPDDSTLVHCACNTVQLLQRFRIRLFLNNATNSPS